MSSLHSWQDGPKTKRVLAVGMVDSVHFARWLEGLSALDLDIHIFPSGPHRSIHPRIKSLRATKGGKFRLGALMQVCSLPIWILDRFAGSRLRAFTLLAALQAQDYDIVHFHEMQSGGYPLSLVPKRVLKKSKIFYTPYGSDLFWFKQFPRHQKRIKRTLGIVDYLFPECDRDAVLALEAGFVGEVGPRMAAAGALEFPKMAPSESAPRDKITVKGYGGTWGRAIEALHSLEKVQEKLLGFEVHVVSATKDVQKEISRLKKTSLLNIVTHPKFSLSSSEVRDLLLQSKYYIALSTSDGFPSLLMEAALSGAVPFQSDTACLPDSLLKINPDSFLAKERWGQVGAAVAALESDPTTTDLLSTKFCDWAASNQLSRADFGDIMSKAYGLK